MSTLELIATATFGLEAVVKRELEKLNYKILRSEDGKITFLGDEQAIVRANLWLRCADRVLIKMGEFSAESFEELFQQTAALPWEEWIPMDGKFTVNVTSVKSKLFSVSDCQAIGKKAIVKRLQQTYDIEQFPETGAFYSVKITLLKDRATVTIDTSGPGLHKRGYRIEDVAAPIKETLAAAMVQLTFWKDDRLLVDPFCGSGTIPIEAAMIGRNIAPGLSRSFVSEEWHAIPKNLWKQERKFAFEAINYENEVRISASDIDSKAVASARKNAEEAGVDDCINFSVGPLDRLKADGDYGIIVTNPPYGERIGEKKQIAKIYKDLSNFMHQNPTWSLYLVTSDREFEKLFREEPADRRRKLYNGRIEICYYQYYGLRPDYNK